MGHSKQQRAAIEERRRKVTGLYLGRVSKTRIAQALAVERHTIAADIRWLEEQWRKELLGDPVAVRAQELAELDDMERETAQHQGDLKWMDRRIKLKERRAKMLGLDAPQKQETAVKGPVNFTIGKGYDDQR